MLPSTTLAHYDNREFEEVECAFSSFAHLIAVCRMFAIVLRLKDIKNYPRDEDISRADVKIQNWRMHLPSDKTQMLLADGRVDEILFQAHCACNL